MLPPGIGGDPSFAERFTREAKALAKLLHPNIVALFEFGQADGIYYLLMEYVDGVSLGQLLRSSRVSPREALAIVPQICDALQYAHDQGIVHRDIKPENILLDRRGRVKVADFGLAKLVEANAPLTPALSPSDGERVAVRPGEGQTPSLTDAGKIMGTPAYMAPEQVEHPADVDHRADIYALGVVFYQMLTGELPGKRLDPPSKKVQIDVRLDEVVLRALEKRPDLRYQQVSEVKTMVETIVGGAGVPPAEPARRNSTGKMIAIGCGVLALGACVVLVVLVAMFWFSGSASRERRGREMQTARQQSLEASAWSDCIRLKQSIAPGANGTGASGNADFRYEVIFDEKSVALTVSYKKMMGGEYRVQIEDKDGGKQELGNRGRLTTVHLGDGQETVEEKVMLTREEFGRIGALILQKRNSPQNASTTRTLSFGPMIERELSGSESLSNSFLDLDSGRVLSAPEELVELLRSKGKLNGGSPSVDLLLDWMRNSGADVMKASSGPWSVQLDAVCQRLADEAGNTDPPEAFDAVSVERVMRALKAAEKKPGEPAAVNQVARLNSRYDGFFAFKTREGSMGVLEVWGEADDSREVKIRYKLVATQRDEGK